MVFQPLLTCAQRYGLNEEAGQRLIHSEQIQPCQWEIYEGAGKKKKKDHSSQKEYKIVQKYMASITDVYNIK